jgi:hypothetical protein
VAAPCSIVFHDTAAVRPGSNDAGELEMSPMWRERLVVVMRPVKQARALVADHLRAGWTTGSSGRRRGTRESGARR